MTVSDAPLPPSRAGSLPLVGGSLAFDFANTESGRGTDQHQNHLREPEDVVAWIEHAEALSGPDVASLRRALDGRPGRAQALLGDALPLRAAIQTVGESIAGGAPPPDDALAALSALHARCLAAGRLAIADGRGFWRWRVEAAPVEAALGPIALAAARLFTEGDFSRIKVCEGHACGWLFCDTSRNNARRWCEMEVCGNRAKQKRLAARRRGQ
ncbi:putative RNA-binding Zn ribbon-like protein [Roseiarcus fermentans]|uniref:Putative RNA-binding Zn ribbon-like protein n=1 Tax=Roseiarcus fermentans TaxID=1473586 RepID=A0A366F496_9HYPH|nr:ABATE domain-containing protein [Roseiarcus fermentans]RBP08589.1 putative RNA-binding Zn ribbon-like protein [Roseiarcus fermentans]